MKVWLARNWFDPSGTYREIHLNPHDLPDDWEFPAGAKGEDGELLSKDKEPGAAQPQTFVPPSEHIPNFPNGTNGEIQNEERNSLTRTPQALRGGGEPNPPEEPEKEKEPEKDDTEKARADLESKTVPQLHAILKAKKISFESDDNKDKLVELLLA